MTNQTSLTICNIFWDMKSNYTRTEEAIWFYRDIGRPFHTHQFIVFYFIYSIFYSNLFVIFIYLNNIIFATHNIIIKLKIYIYRIKERNTAYKLINNYILSIKIKLNLNQMKYLKHLPFLFKLTDLVCLKGYVFFCFIFDFQNILEMIKDGNNSFTPTGPQIRFS